MSIFTAKSDFKNTHNILPNILNYRGTPDSPNDRFSLSFSDQGAWFSYGFPSLQNSFGGFVGPFLMTEQNGVWCSQSLSQLDILIDNTRNIEWNDFSALYESYNSHLKQVFTSDELEISQILFYTSAHTALIISEIKNISKKAIAIKPFWSGKIFLENLKIVQKDNLIEINSDKSLAKGYIQILDEISNVDVNNNSYEISLEKSVLKPNESRKIFLTQSFIFPEYDIEEELKSNEILPFNYEEKFNKRVEEKDNQLQSVFDKINSDWDDPKYKNLISKLILTLQNNWRNPAGNLKHSGIFPSYHYEWFHGIWAWDSYKHAAAVSLYDSKLAKEQIKAMFDYQKDNGFILDCVYRNNDIEDNNYRNSKPPLSAWAVWTIFENDNDLEFIKELYPKIVKQHEWWYNKRDNNGNGLCEYGSTDGTIIAGKWESGMDNAVRFDKSEILENSEEAYSLNQESVDLNSYLYAEKLYLAKMAEKLGLNSDKMEFEKEALVLKERIQNDFFDLETGWFYDIKIDDKSFIKVKGCEGWIPLWAGIATKEQAEKVKTIMMDENEFNTKVPLQTLTADHPKFKPEGGYWRGPNWLDQSYFGIKALQKYGYSKEAKELAVKLIANAEGVSKPGYSIRENYNPVTGKGLEAQNFSWSAAHYLLLMIRG